ncbi:MAG: ABC-F family ATP-binding cassette domain-containing protein [Ilumatobacteraceae bacterium]|nr:ABC-F family ATP-binding cassette domain-containing protein [Ilumatobacteraceae bacterium]
MICVDLAGVGAAQPDKVLFEGLDLTIASGDRVAITGINGSGKTTLLNICTGALVPDEGTVRFGRDVRTAVLAQEPALPAGTVGATLGDRWEVAAAATVLGVADLVDRPTDQLSGGQAKRVALASVLADDEYGEVDFLVLDEPTNHLDLEAIEWLERRLTARRAAVLLITHDRHLLDHLTARDGGRVVELDRGRAFVHRAAPGRSAYATSLDGRAERMAREQQAEMTRRNLARRELAWLRRGAPARSSKPKSRLLGAAAILDGGDRRNDVRSDPLDFAAGTYRLGNQVIELDGVSIGFPGEPVPLLADLDLVIEPGARLAVVGPNGSGKSTLLDVLADRRQPLTGTVRRGSTVVTGVADQHAASLDPDGIVRELVAGPHGQPDHRHRALLERFWFDTPAQYAPVRMLSGGERRRLQLVMVLAAEPNVLLLDEPTNDLDLDTLRALEDFLDDWPGALVVASHDRTFLDRVADHVLAVEPPPSAGMSGRVRRVPGGVGGWLAERAAVAPSAPKSAGTTAAPRRDWKQRSSGPSPSTLRRRLREVEKTMNAAQRKVSALTVELAGTTEHEHLARLGDELSVAQGALDSAESEWLELAEQLE